MGITNRPYIGTYVPNKRKVVQYTPDVLVYLNGDTGMAGCAVCRQRIDIQQFVTSVSVDAGVEAGASSASISLSIPRHYGNTILRDGNTVLRNGLEVHIYLRGYFPMTGLATEGEDTNAGIPLSDVPQYPYYPVFHGVVTGVSHEYSSGYYTASLNCSGMLHFWQYMQISSSGSYFGTRPDHSNIRTNLRGHNLTGMTPYSILYFLYRDIAGAAAGVGFALNSRSNYRATSSTTGDSAYSLTIRYWENRFADGMYGLRMHGTSGTLFTSAQQAFVARLNSNQGRVLAITSPNTPDGAGRRGSIDPYLRTADAIGLIDTERVGSRLRVSRGADLRYLSSANERDRSGVVVPQMQAFVNDISQYGQVNLFESTYESKLDIATQVTNVCGYEFYQDMDGDLVFKPPLYNLDTSSSRVYRIEAEDIISISFNETEPEATYCIVKGGVFQNLRGAVDAAEWGSRGTYIDYRLVAQFGWRESSVESNYYNNARSAFYAAIANLDRVNKGVNSCSITIPIRPELRPGYPVYIPNIDCFYYVESLSHSFSFGGSCTTTLNLVARRRKFFPPGSGKDSVEDIDLAQTAEAPRTFQYLDNSQQPRLLGFPNVVMALDPEHINPLFYAIGFLAEETGLREGRNRETPENFRDQFLSNLIMLLITTQVITASAESEPEAEPEAPRAGRRDRGARRSGRGRGRRGRAATPTVGAIPTSIDERTRQLTGPWAIPTGFTTEGGGSRTRFTFEELRNALRSLLSIRDNTRRRLQAISREIEDLEQQYQTAAFRASGTREGDEAVNASLAGLRDQINRRRAEAEQISDFLELGEYNNTPAQRQLIEQFATQENDLSTRVSLDNDDGSVTNTTITEDQARQNLLLLMFLFRQIRERNPASATRDMELDGTGTINNSSMVLELLGDRKAAIGLNTPGYYRYYSCSHPNPDQQGYVPLASAPSTTEAAPANRIVIDEPFVFTATEAAPTSRIVIEDPFVITAGAASPNRIVIEDPFVISAVSSPSSTATATATPAAPTTATTTEPTVSPSSTETPPTSSRIPTVTMVRNLNAVPEGLPTEQQKDFVSLTDEVPTNGLNVRTFVNRDPVPTPTSEIFALSFESREAVRRGRTVILQINTGAKGAIQDPVGTYTNLLANSLKSAVPNDVKTNASTTAQALVERAVAGITNLRGPSGPITDTDINAGTPNNNPNPPVDPPTKTLGEIAGATDAAALEAVIDNILRQKASRLLTQVSAPWQANRNRAVERFPASGSPGEEASRDIRNAISGWFNQIIALFRNRRPANAPISYITRAGVFPQTLTQFSPVFPVSDALGYEHYGTYQYGRGLSIEPGGNYQRLMSLDPFQYVDRRLVDDFVRQLLAARGDRNNAEVQAVIRTIARQLSDSREPGAESLALRFSENVSPSDDRTAMIANGMANYIFSDRDSVSKLPVSNAAFLLSDIQPPNVSGSGCDCRGAEADILLGALMSGADTSNFVSVQGQEDPGSVAATWTREQMILASDGWAAAQAAMRGQFNGNGRSSLFDSFRGWSQAGKQLSAPFDQLTQGVDSATRQGDTNLSRLTNRLNDLT